MSIRGLRWSRWISRPEGVLHLTLANPSLEKEATVKVSFDNLKPRTVSGEILKAAKIQAYNEFGKEPAVAPTAYKDAKVAADGLTLKLPAASVVVLEVR